MSRLKFLIAGNVDDGKSTLTGRLLLETKSIHEDIIQNNISTNSKLLLSHFSDGLKEERLKGITIDVSYKFLSISGKKYILIDAPGHFKYVKNLISGASQSNLVLIIIDVSIGITDQTVLHYKIAEFLNVENVIFVLNKMDLINYKSDIYYNIIHELKNTLSISKKCNYVPISALFGENILNKSDNLDWYDGPTLISVIENSSIDSQIIQNFRMQVYSIINNTCYARVLSGSLNKNYLIYLMSKKESPLGYKLQYFNNSMKVDSFIKFSNCFNFNKGDILYYGKKMKSSKSITTNTFWMSSINLNFDKYYIIKIGIVEYLVKPDKELYDVEFNSFNKITFNCYKNIIYDTNKENFITSRGVIIDKVNFDTIGVFVILN